MKYATELCTNLLLDHMLRLIRRIRFFSFVVSCALFGHRILRAAIRSTMTMTFEKCEIHYSARVIHFVMTKRNSEADDEETRWNVARRNNCASCAWFFFSYLSVAHAHHVSWLVATYLLPFPAPCRHDFLSSSHAHTRAVLFAITDFDLFLHLS